MSTAQWAYGLLKEVIESLSTGVLLFLGNYTAGSPVPLKFIAIGLAIDVIVAEARFLSANPLPTNPPTSKTTP